MRALVVVVVDGGMDAQEFLNEAQTFAQIHGVPDEDVLIYDDRMLSKEQMRQAFYSDCAARRGRGYDLFAYFGHGGNCGKKYPGGWIQLHFNQNPSSAGYVENMASALSDCLSSAPVVMLYACLAAAGPDPEQKAWGYADPVEVASGGFAEALCETLCEYGMPGSVVLGHTTSGHATKNPMVLGVTDCGNEVFWHVDPYSGAAWSEWVDAVHDFSDELRFRFPIDYVQSGKPVPMKESSGRIAIVAAGAVLGAAVWYALSRR